MATTAQYVFQVAMALADEVEDTGLFTDSDYDNYKVRAPYILTMLESELLSRGNTFTTYTLDETDEPFVSATGTEEYVRITLPSDFHSIDEVKWEDDYGNIYPVVYKTEGRSTILVSPITSGDMYITYRPIPTAITALTDSMTVDDVTARTVLPYGLAAELFKDEKDDLYPVLYQRYQQLKKDMTIRPAKITDTIDVYGWC
jgi:hypothetical protein